MVEDFLYKEAEEDGQKYDHKNAHASNAKTVQWKWNQW